MDGGRGAGRGLPGRGPPGRGMPGRGPPGRGMPGRGPPGRGMPGRGPPGRGMPGRGMPGRGPPGRGPPGRGPPGRGAPPQADASEPMDTSGPFEASSPSMGGRGGMPGRGMPGRGAPPGRGRGPPPGRGRGAPPGRGRGPPGGHGGPPGGFGHGPGGHGPGGHGGHGPPPVGPFTAENPRLQLKKWNAVAYWTWGTGGDDNTCTICTNALEIPCLCVCEANPHLNEECTVATGQCGHSFHSHCILSWIKKTSTCPKDDEEWVQMDN